MKAAYWIAFSVSLVFFAEACKKIRAKNTTAEIRRTLFLQPIDSFGKILLEPIGPYRVGTVQIRWTSLGDTFCTINVFSGDSLNPSIGYIYFFAYGDEGDGDLTNIRFSDTSYYRWTPSDTDTLIVDKVPNDAIKFYWNKILVHTLSATDQNPFTLRVRK